MSNVVRLPVAARSGEGGWISPSLLHQHLPATTTMIVTFGSEREMERYRRNLYEINRQGEFRYRTLRDEGSMWGLVIWRMK